MLTAPIGLSYTHLCEHFCKNKTQLKINISKQLTFFILLTTVKNWSLFHYNYNCYLDPFHRTIYIYIFYFNFFYFFRPVGGGGGGMSKNKQERTGGGGGGGGGQKSLTGTLN